MSSLSQAAYGMPSQIDGTEIEEMQTRSKRCGQILHVAIQAELRLDKLFEVREKRGKRAVLAHKIRERYRFPPGSCLKEHLEALRKIRNEGCHEEHLQTNHTKLKVRGLKRAG